jgi:hypothetical protein
MKEVVRSGRRANFYITENSFIDNYARDVKPLGIAVYHVLERHANCDTRSTWIGTKKMADLLGYSPRQIQRTLKTLQDLKLIRILEAEDRTTYVVVPVPPRAKSGTTPLFDQIPDEPSLELTSDCEEQTRASGFATPVSHTVTDRSRATTSVSRPASQVSEHGDIGDDPYKEEQDSLNKTFEQWGPERQAAERVVNMLGLISTSRDTVTAAIKAEVERTDVSLDEAVISIVTEANRAKRRGAASHEKFLEDLVAQASAQQVIEALTLPATPGFISTVTAAVKAEAKYMGLSIQEAVGGIVEAAAEDRRRGVSIDKFYFEDVKWRSNARVSKAEQRKLGNLEVNARVKQRLREKLGAS